MTPRPTTIEEVQAAVREHPRLLPRGGGTKPALSSPTDGVTAIDLSALAGVVEYEPGEFTFTARAGTRIADVAPLLAEHGQYLPFDPLLVDRGATLGGTVAANTSGPGRYHYGGIRDFLLGVRYVDGDGQVVHGGGKVVKNAAGFDLPKLMVGSLGQLGILVELTFKVFPRAEAHTTFHLTFDQLNDALEATYRLYASSLDIDSLDLEPTRSGATLWVRLGGLKAALPARIDRLRQIVGDGEVIEGADEVALWRKVREMEWMPAQWSLIKVPLTISRIAALESNPIIGDSLRRYSSGGQVGWIASPENPQTFEAALIDQGLAALAIFGPPGRARLGVRASESFEQRVKAALDPNKRFVEA